MINWGIIGAGNIAHRFANSLEKIEGARLYAVARRTIAKAEEFRQQHPCEAVYDDYQALIDDENVDAIYIALPHILHLEWVEKSLTAKKAVLCEKPATMNLNEMKRIQQIATEEEVFFMEAMKSRFTKAYRSVKNHIENGDIGELQDIHTSLCRVFKEEDASYHYDADQGGCLLDMGVYNIALIEDYMNMPATVESIEYEVTPIGVETYVNAKLRSSNISATVESAFDRDTETVAVFTGSNGSIRMNDFHRPTTYELVQDGKSHRFNIPHEVDDFYGEIQHVVLCLTNGLYESPIMPLEDSVYTATIMDEIKSKIK